MVKEGVASSVKYCTDNGVSYKARLSELGVPKWMVKTAAYYSMVVFTVIVCSVLPTIGVLIEKSSEYSKLLELNS